MPTGACRSSSSDTTSACPPRAAQCRPVCPSCLTDASTGIPCSSMKATTSVLPYSHAQANPASICLTVAVEVVLHQIETAEACCAFEVQARTARRQVLRGGTASIGQASRDERVVVAGDSWTIDHRAVIDQDLHQGVVHARALGVNAGRNEAKRRAAPTIHIGFGVHVGT